MSLGDILVVFIVAALGIACVALPVALFAFVVYEVVG